MNEYTKATEGRKKPQLYVAPFSGEILCAPKWRLRKDGLFEATGETYDVTMNAVACVAKYLEDHDVTETDPKTGKRYRLVLSKVEVIE